MRISFQQTTNLRPFDPIQLRRKQCSSTLIDEDLPRMSHSSSSSGFRSHSSTDDFECVHPRTNIIKEIYKTEYDYLGHLRNLVEVSVNDMIGGKRENIGRVELFEENAFANGFIF